MSEDAGIEPRTVATTALAVRGSNHSARSHPQGDVRGCLFSCVCLRVRLLPLCVHYVSVNSAGILEQSMGARNRVRVGLSYWPARLERLAKSIPWNRFLGFLIV